MNLQHRGEIESQREITEDNISDVTVLLSLTVFLNQVSDSMPNTSDAVPLISRFRMIIL